MTCCFARLGARALLPTRLDLVRRLGGVPAAADAGRRDAAIRLWVAPADAVAAVAPPVFRRPRRSASARFRDARQILVGPDQSSQRRCSAPRSTAGLAM